jgi:hypothetical protein
MELAIPIGALGGLYYISDKSKKKKENFEGNSSRNNNNNPEYPGEIPKNYPVSTDEELRDTSVNRYPKSNQRTDKYFSKNVSYDTSINNQSNTREINSLSGNVLNTEEFKHNNMVPYFGAKIRGRTADSHVHEQILDNMVGAGSQSVEKKENAPMFKPEENMQYSHGAPNMNNFYQSRVNASNRMANVKPWEEVQVGPGLAEGFSSTGSGGFNSGLNARDTYKPKDVNDLRVKTNPKTSYELSSHEGPANYYNKSSSNTNTIGKVEKYLPDTYYENGPERYFTTTGIEQRPTARGLNDNKKLENMNNVGFYSGTQSTNGPYREPAPQTYKASDKCDQEKQGYLMKQRNYTGDPREGDYGLNSIKLGKTNRDCNPQYTVFNGIKKTVGALFAPITDIMRPSRKEDIVENFRVYGNPSDSTHSGFIEGTYQSPNVTNRDMNLGNEEYFGNIQKQNIHSTNNTKHQVTEQQRETTSVPYGGIAGSAESSGQTSYYSNYNQTNNETKENMVYSRTNLGNASQFNNSINMSISKQDSLESSREFVPSGAPQMLPPSTSHIGITNISHEANNFQSVDRMQPDILDAFKKNPYTHSLHSTA